MRELQVLADEEKNIIGRYLGLHSGVSQWIDDATAPYGHRELIKMATIFVNSDLNDNTGEMDCEYVDGDLDSYKFHTEKKCVWVDQYSKPANKKPYCW